MTETRPRSRWNLAHYERHLTTVTLDMRNWIDRGANRTVQGLAFDAVTLLDGLRRDHDPLIAEPLIARMLFDAALDEATIRTYAAAYAAAYDEEQQRYVSS